MIQSVCHCLSQSKRTRRSLALGLLTLPFLMRGRQALGQAPPGPIVTGDCRTEPGVTLIAEFDLGLPVMPIPDLLPPLDWARYFNPQIGLTFLYPGTWSAQTLWAEQLSPQGAPLWTTQQPFVPALTTARIVSPDGDAAFEAAVGTLYGALLSPLQAATVAELGMAGEGSRLTPICDYENRNPLAPSWFRAAYADDSVLVSEGYALPSPSAFTPNTVVTYYAMIGPRAEFEVLMREVYLRILFQFLPGGGEEPTPTPVP